jgi:membrane protein
VKKAVEKLYAHITPWLHSAQRLLQKIVLQSDRVKLPLFDGLSVYNVLSFFFKGIYEGAVTSRAGSISFSFFMALFPGVIFLFTLIPYIPIDGFQEEIFELLKGIMPPSSYELAESTIVDVVSIKRSDILFFTLITTLVFATNGTLSLISNFSISIHKIAYRGFWGQYLSAIVLTVVLSFLLLISIALVSLGESFFDWLVAHGHLERMAANLMKIGRIIILLFTILLSISLLYNYGPIKGKHWQLISPGSLLATTLVILSSVAFGFYVDNFATYNKLYGSIGTLLVIMLWIYINAIGLIIGFELNASIAGAKYKRELEKQLELKL